MNPILPDTEKPKLTPLSFHERAQQELRRMEIERRRELEEPEEEK
jgi:hypothetical protein